MKKFLALILCMAAAAASAATLTPIQLLNPSGSTEGQAILSTGPNTPPQWGNVSISALSGTLPIANGGTGATTAATARTNLGLGTAATANTGTTGATVPLLNGSNTWSATQTFTSAIVPSQTAGIVGTTTNNNAAAGAVGEYVSVTGSAGAMTTGTVANCASTTLTPGDWDVNGSIFFSPGGPTTIQGIEAGLTTTSATMPASPLYSSLYHDAFTTGTGQSMSVPSIRVSVAASTTVYLVGRATFGTSTMNCVARITARRVR